MNLEDIKRSLNKRTNFNQPSQNFNKPKEEPKEEPKQQPKEEPKKSRYINKQFEPDSEEEKEPQSEVWNTDFEQLDLLDPMVITIENLKLNDDVYDWRRSTSKGRKSHKNFTYFLKENL